MDAEFTLGTDADVVMTQEEEKPKGQSISSMVD